MRTTKATMESYDCQGQLTMNCSIVFRDGFVALSWKEIDGNGRMVVYEGEEIGPGHYRLKCDGVRGRGTLHRWPLDSSTLEGTWVEKGAIGMWTIDMEEEDD